MAPWMVTAAATILTAHHMRSVDTAAQGCKTGLALSVLRRINRSVTPAVWGRPRERTCSQKPCNHHFRRNSLRDAACRKRYKKALAARHRRKACGSKDTPVRSSISLPFTEVKRIPANLNEITALQRALACRSAGNKDRPIRAKKRLRAAHLNGPVLGKNAVVFE
jgi:hypothetical protein